MSSLPINTIGLITETATNEAPSQFADDEIDLDNIEDYIIDSPMEQTPTNEPTKKPQRRERKRTRKDSRYACYHNGCFMSYVNSHRLQYNAYDKVSFNNALIQAFKRVKHGGYNNGVYTKINQRENTTPLIINSVKCIGGRIDANNENFTHNFVELHYYGDKRFNNLVDIITTRDFVREFNRLLIRYNTSINKGLHYINDEINKLTAFNIRNTRQA